MCIRDRRSRPRILVTDTQHAARVADVRERLALEHLLVHGGSSELPEAEELATVAVAGALEPDMSGFSRGDICSVLWTSGTTGKSKGCLLYTSPSPPDRTRSPMPSSA